jgi:hypothetical protein
MRAITRFPISQVPTVKRVIARMAGSYSLLIIAVVSIGISLLIVAMVSIRRGARISVSTVTCAKRLAFNEQTQ